MPRQAASTARSMDEETIKGIIEKAIQDLTTKDDMQKLIVRLEEKLERLLVEKIDEIKKPLEDKIQGLESKLSVYEAHMQDLEVKIDDNEQYSRRSSLRITGIPLPQNEKESSEECTKKVMDVFAELEVDISEDGIDRAHRVGKKTTDGDGIEGQAMIVKLNSWKDRVAVYRERKKLKDKRIYVDLTFRRAKLLKLAQTLVKTNPVFDFAFADINCRLGVKGTDDRFQFFNTKEELLSIVG